MCADYFCLYLSLLTGVIYFKHNPVFCPFNDSMQSKVYCKQKADIEEAQRAGVPPFFAITCFFCNHFEELQTVLIEVKLIINNAPLTYVYQNTIKTFSTQSFVVWQTVIMLF